MDFHPVLSSFREGFAAGIAPFRRAMRTAWVGMAMATASLLLGGGIGGSGRLPLLLPGLDRQGGGRGTHAGRRSRQRPDGAGGLARDVPERLTGHRRVWPAFALFPEELTGAPSFLIIHPRRTVEQGIRWRLEPSALRPLREEPADG